MGSYPVSALILETWLIAEIPSHENGRNRGGKTHSISARVPEGKKRKRVSALSQKIKEIELERERGEGSERAGGREYRFLWISKGVTLVSTDGDKYQDSIEVLLFVLFFPMQCR